jgi:chorismate synthase
MAGNSFGQLFRVTTFGESHGECIGVVIDGCPPRLEISESDIQKELDRRRPGQSKITSSRKEEDKVHIMSGVVNGKTAGTPIMLFIANKDARMEDYRDLKNIYRPGHADYTYNVKYGIRDLSGGGRASARETLARVAAGAIAKKYLKEKLGIEFISFVEQVGDIKTDMDFNLVTVKDVESNIVRCPDQKMAKKMMRLIETVRGEGDSLGGVIRGVIKNVPVGLGEPVFDKLPADLAKAMMSINAVKGFEIGSGFNGTKLRGSQNNDEFYIDNKGKIRTKTNNAGGTLGGISNGGTIHFRVAVKPVSTIGKRQHTINKNGEAVTFEAHGRHDPCVLPRVVPIVDAMAALVVMDHYLRTKAQNLCPFA